MAAEEAAVGLAPKRNPLRFGIAMKTSGSGSGGGFVGGTSVAFAVASNSDTLPLAEDSGLGFAGGSGCRLGTSWRFLGCKLAGFDWGGETALRSDDGIATDWDVGIVVGFGAGIELDFAIARAAASDAGEAASAGLAGGVSVARTPDSADFADAVAAETASSIAAASLDYSPVWSERAPGSAFVPG